MSMMSGQVFLLDCTLRDGGDNNDWQFGRDTLIGVAERVVNAGIEFMELGFLDQRRTFDPNRSIMPNCPSHTSTSELNRKIDNFLRFGKAR